MLRDAIGGGNDEEWWLTAFYGAALLVALVVALFTCVCNPKSKRFRKHRSFILSHDLPANEVPPTNVDHLAMVVSSSSPSSSAANTTAQCSVHHHNRMGSSSSCSAANQHAQSAVVGDTVDCSCNKLKANRALPDIPGPGESMHQQQQHQQNQPFNSTSMDDVDSLYTVANCNGVPLAGASTSTGEAVPQNNIDSNHPYARIRNHLPVDSSTENDTDDYSVDQQDPLSPPEPSVQYHGHQHYHQQEPSPSHVIGQSFRPAVIVANGGSNTVEASVNAYELEPQPHILRLQLRSNPNNGHSDQQANSSVYATNGTKEKVEISYNTISVREPLSKVLADRDNTVEHHYNEVEEERLSSFYEEIATTSPGSSTYSMPSTSRGIGYRQSASTSKQATASSSSAAVAANGGPVYSFIDKKSKKSALQGNSGLHQQPPPPPPLSEANNLYTMVVKSPAKNSSLAVSTSNSVDSKPLPIALQRYSPPPPLPPPLPHSTQAKSMNRNTIMFGTPSTSSGSAHHLQHNSHFPVHQYHHNLADLHDYNTISHDVESASSSAHQNIYQKISSKKGGSKRPPQPPPPPAHPDPFAPEEKDPGYEVVVDRSQKAPTTTALSDDNSYGYEAIMLDNADPAYEIVKPESNGDGASDDNSPAYETIKNEAAYSRLDDLLGTDDGDSDPNYEIIVNNHHHHNHNHQQQLNLNPRSAQQQTVLQSRPMVSEEYQMQNHSHNQHQIHQHHLHQHHLQHNPTPLLHHHVHQHHNHTNHNHNHHRHVHSPTKGLLLDENVIIEHL